MAISKAALKKQLHAVGIKTYKNKVTGVSYVKKNDVKRVLAADDLKEGEWYVIRSDEIDMDEKAVIYEGPFDREDIEEKWNEYEDKDILIFVEWTDDGWKL